MSIFGAGKGKTPPTPEVITPTPPALPNVTGAGDYLRARSRGGLAGTIFTSGAGALTPPTGDRKNLTLGGAS